MQISKTPTSSKLCGKTYNRFSFDTSSDYVLGVLGCDRVCVNRAKEKATIVFEAFNGLTADYARNYFDEFRSMKNS